MKARVLKTVGVVMAMVMCLGMTTLAAGSREATTKGNATDKNGKAITVTVKKTAESDKAQATIATAAGLKSAMGSAYNANMVVLDVVDVIVPEGTAFPITLTFNVNGVSAGATGYMMHWNGSGWDAPIKAATGNGTMSATVSSCSPYAFVVDKTTVSGNKVSPKTNASSTAAVALVGLCAVVAVCGLKKKSVVK